jgi:hypothetical protein
MKHLSATHRYRMFIISSLALLMTSVPGLLSAQQDEPQKLDPAAVEFFEKKIRPVLVTYCYKCHSSDSDKVKGGLLLDSREAARRGGESGEAVVPGKPDQSLLLSALRYDDFQMPPKGKLPEAVIADFEKWIASGAADPRLAVKPAAQSQIDLVAGLKFWSFQPAIRAELPAVEKNSWPRNAIDHFILARLEETGLQPNPQADKRALIRRAYFDLVGLPPTPAQVADFLADESQDAFATVVEELLDSPHYGERWGRRWLDIARYGEDQAHTFKARKYPRGYLYRDWVVEAFNADKSYDRFLLEQIAGDLLDEPNRHERIAALGLFALGPVYYQDNGEKAKALADEWDDRIDTLSRGVLGLTVSCARCHDHKYDPLSMSDYYGLAGIFASSNYQERPVVSEEIIQRRRAADEAVKQQQLAIDRFLVDQARELRPTLVDEIPAYVLAAWTVLNRRKKDAKNNKLSEQVAKQQKLSRVLLDRWIGYLKPTDKADQLALRPQLTDWRELLATQLSDVDLSDDEAARAAVQAFGESLAARATELLPQRAELVRQFGDNLAFVQVKDRAVVPPGQIPLGNLFDDAAGVSLATALSSDKFKAAASADKLGVDRISKSLGGTVEIAKGINFQFSRIGGDNSNHGSIVNDGWNTDGGIRTEGKKVAANIGRQEQGIGMHANAMITFDLAEIRQAGLLPPDQRFVFISERAGINDDMAGSSVPSAHLAVILSRPHSKDAVYDAVISAQVNGQPLQVDENDMVYYFSAQPPAALTADGTFARFEIAVPADARYLTLVATGAGTGDGDNTINSDHTVFSGARLELDPPLTPAAVADKPTSEGDSPTSEDARRAALLLSWLLYDEGLLALPGAEAEAKLPEAAKQQLAGQKEKLKTEQDLANAIQVTTAHSLSEGTGADLKIYLSGDPAKPGEAAPRAMPAILTAGEKIPFPQQGSGRLSLARSIASPDNTLTARVMINRIWQGHFGEGLVRTTSNFGSLGDAPSHPQLLDWLSLEFVEQGWSIKQMHRLIMLSATYQQSSQWQDDALERDPENRLLWRMNRRRLEIEPWRDALLAVTGELDVTLGGPSRQLNDKGNNRRTIYGFISRHELNELLRLFDFPDPNITSAQRTVTTVPLQQLFVLNSDFMAARARALAVRLEMVEGTNGQRIEHAYQLLFARSPSEQEVALAVQFLEQDEANKEDKLTRWQQYALALLGTNEFLYVD